jgi:hypothetical protein
MTRQRKPAIGLAEQLADTLPAPAPASTPGRPSLSAGVPKGRHGAHRSGAGHSAMPATGRVELLEGETPAQALARVTGKWGKLRSDRKPVAAPFCAPAPTGDDQIAGFAVPVVTANESNGSHQHYRVVTRRRKHIRAETTRAAVESGCPVPAPPLVVTITRHSAGVLDDDGLRSATKSVRDGVAKWLGVDDKRRELVAYEYAQSPCKRGLGWVTVEIRRKAE